MSKYNNTYYASINLIINAPTQESAEDVLEFAATLAKGVKGVLDAYADGEPEGDPDNA